MFQSNYSSGLRIYDARCRRRRTPEVAYFDVYRPAHHNPGFGLGTWSYYAWFDSGVAAVHGYQGLFLVKPRLGERMP